MALNVMLRILDFIPKVTRRQGGSLEVFLRGDSRDLCTHAC